MAIDFKVQQVGFPPTTGKLSSVETVFVFDSAVRKAQTALNGYRVAYAGFDGNFGAVRVDTSVVDIVSNTVRVRVDFGLRDASGLFDDAYEGFVDVLAIVDRA
jgi:hypothetical protein